MIICLADIICANLFIFFYIYAFIENTFKI